MDLGCTFVACPPVSEELLMSPNIEQFNRFRSQYGLRVGMLCLLLASVFANSSHAGCHRLDSQPGKLHFSGFTPETLAEVAWWTVGPVERFYEGGRFIYYEVSTPLRPCNQPGCRGSAPEPVMSIPPIAGSTRVTLLAGQRCTSFVSLPDVDVRRKVSLSVSAWVNPILDGPLRPPCSVA